MENIDFLNKSVILRTDYNVPISNRIITSTIRIDESIKTIKFIFERKLFHFVFLHFHHVPVVKSIFLRFRSLS